MRTLPSSEFRWCGPSFNLLQKKTLASVLRFRFQIRATSRSWFPTNGGAGVVENCVRISGDGLCDAAIPSNQNHVEFLGRRHAAELTSSFCDSQRAQRVVP